jgi:hypothetical protein
MSDELKPCQFCGNDAVHVHDSYCAGSGFMVLCANCTGEGPLCNTEDEAASEWNRRAAPVSAPLDNQALPPLPSQHEELRAQWKCEDCDGTGEVGELIDQGYFQPPERARCSTCDGAGQVPIVAYTDDQMRGYARDHAAPYAARIAHLERELAERKPESIDTAEFQSKVGNWSGAAHSSDKYTRTIGAKEAWAALIAYIDGRTAGTAPEKFGCHCDLEDHMEPDDCVIGTSCAGDCAYAHRHANKEACEYWQPIKIAAAPSPLPPKEETK